MAIVETENLTKYYGKSRGILEVTLSIQEGEFFGFIGPNGAGKSTTIRTLMSLLHPSSGRAEIFGLDCRTQGPRIRKQVGYLPAEANYYDDMRVGAFFEYAMRFYPGSSRERLDMLCERLDVDRTKRIGALSTGNKKKLAVVQALLHEPRLLILDEPTTG
ncbi:MAG: ABC transporter ATP-binding protein, partial [Clostridiaceae bacterium]|nr:ABC transporter ATP-binding protein [Clostridiaceae bacterium]